ncbi:MAG: hypothetical protein ACSLEN_05465 [Candidatus Malihini olakiniferum]
MPTTRHATLLAVVLITSFFALSGWAFMQYAGASNVAELGAKDPGMFVFTITEQVLVQWAIQVISVLLITSFFATTQAFHNTLSRYLFAISHNGLLWSKIAKTHRTHQTPYIASLLQGTFMLCATVLFILAQSDPMANVFSWASALGGMSILVLQFSVSLAVLAYFQRNLSSGITLELFYRSGSIRTLDILATLALVVNNLDVLSCSSFPVVSSLYLSGADGGVCHIYECAFPASTKKPRALLTHRQDG